MEQFISDNYIFNFNENSKAKEDIIKISNCQENCFKFICDVLKVKPDFKITYYLCDTPEQVGQIYGDGQPCNGFAAPPDKVYAVYNDNIKCIGFHEDVHLLSYLINKPNSTAISEGLAMYFDKQWWGISNFDWSLFYLKDNKYIPINDLLDQDIFFSQKDSLTYPIMGCFTEWLINTFGIEKYLMMWKQKDSVTAFDSVYHISIKELSEKFENYLHLFKLDSSLEDLMYHLIKNY